MVHDLSTRLGFQLLFVVTYGLEQRVDLKLLHLLKVHLALQDLSLLFKSFLIRNSVSLQVLNDERDTLIAVLVHKNFECPALLLVITTPEREHDLVIGFKTVFDLLN